MSVERYRKWAKYEYSKKQRILLLIPLAIIFIIVIPLLLFLGSTYFDQWLKLPKFIYNLLNVYGLLNIIVGLILIVPGWIFSFWSILAQFKIGHGTPVPLMATQKLINQKPFSYCRNPMALGSIILYFGVTIWFGSFSAIGFVLLYTIIILIYIKLIEEKELEARFGAEYLEYRKNTPFLIPRFGLKNR